MKKLLFALVLLISANVNAQVPEIRLSPQVITTDKNGGSIEKGDTVALNIMFKGNGSNIRNFYFDFQHQISAINLLTIGIPQAGAQNVAVPAGGSTSVTNNYYPGYYWNDNANNNTENGLQNAQYASYGYTQNGTRAINRISINTATPNGNVTNLNDGILAQLLFRVETVQAGFAYDSIYLNFVYGWGNNGVQQTVTMPRANASSWVALDPTQNALINGTFETNANLLGGLKPVLAIIDSATNQVKAYPQVSSNNTFVLSSELLPNTTYYATAFVNSDSVGAIMNKAVTVSDYTAALSEWNKQDLGGTFGNTVMKTGMGYFASDVNQNQKFDGGDLTLLFAQAVGADTIVEKQSNSATTNIPIFTKAYFDSVGIPTALAQSINISWYGYKVKFKTSNVATNLDLKYVIPGDINRSHSSQVVVNGQIQTNKTGGSTGGVTTFSTVVFPNTTNESLANINVNLNNLTVTSNTIEIPVNIDAKGNKVSALQFEFVYDVNKVKFEEIKSEVPNTWFVFANPKDGVLRFGAIDKDLKTSITGTSAPFKLKFSSIGNGVDLNTKIKVTSNLDASDDQGRQLGINLNTTTIKLTGYNNF